MSTTGNWRGPNIVSDKLVFYLDAGSPNSYFDKTGLTWKNISGYTNDGTLINGPTYNSSNGGAIVFDGTNDYASFPNSTNLDNQKITMESWVYPNNTLSQQGFVFEKGQVNTQYSNFFYTDGYFYFRIIGLSSQDLSVVSSTCMTANAWNHIVCTYETGIKTIYTNGNQVAQVTGLTGTISTNTTGIFLGAYYNGPGNQAFYLNGRIAVSRVYSKALSLSEVKQNFNASKTRFGL
jgi:hypothetical protein